MIYRAFCTWINSRYDEQTVFLDAANYDQAAQRLKALLVLVWRAQESDIEFYNLNDEDELRSHSLHPDVGDQYLLECGSDHGKAVYCQEPLLLVGPRSLTRLRAALKAVADLQPPLTDYLEAGDRGRSAL